MCARAWSRFWSLAWRERWLLMTALVMQPAVAASLRLLGFRSTCALLQATSPAPARPAAAPRRPVAATARMVDVAAHRGAPRGTCLTRSLTLWWLLRWQGVDSDLRIGVRRSDRKFEAHAWLERDGVVLNDRPDVSQDYSPFTPIDLANVVVS